MVALLLAWKFPLSLFGTTRFALLDACLSLVSCLAHSSTLKMEMIRSSETSVDFHRAIRRYILEDRNRYNTNFRPNLFRPFFHLQSPLH
jgi:hypothetical protein